MPDPNLPLPKLCYEIRQGYGARDYGRFHAPRFALLLKLVAELTPKDNPRILDIGISEFADILRDSLEVPIDTLDVRADAKSERGNQYFFDLSECDERANWRRDLPIYDLVVMAEVIEHVYASPKFQLEFLRSLLKPGGVLILQTPNALDLSKRIKPLLGRHPYEQIRTENKYGGHVREYTAKELRAYALAAGFEVERLLMGSYFDVRHKAYEGRTKSRFEASVWNWVSAALPGPLRPGITIVLRAGA